jgi:FkbM family methyltransferase
MRLLAREERRTGLQPGTWAGRMKNGTRLELPTQSLMTWHVAFAGAYDLPFVREACRFVEPDSIVLDVGASLGLWTVQLAAYGEVWAFEPNPANIPWIRRNLELNGLSKRVRVCNFGLGDEAANATLVGTEYGVGNGLIAITDRPSTDKHPRVAVSLKPLDDVELPSRVSLIKVDVEGFEVAFLRGARETIERDRPVIFGEFAKGWIERRGEDLRAALFELDYEVSVVKVPAGRLTRSRTVVEPVDITGQLPVNLLLRPRAVRNGPGHGWDSASVGLPRRGPNQRASDPAGD